jgi:undecaprenyl-diphosphatase
METWQAVLLGILEGLTEFIPVSSTGHVLLAGYFLGVQSPGRAFEVLIQLGAILAILAVYFGRLWATAAALPYKAQARSFALSVLIAFLPAAVVGAALHGFIKSVLFESPGLICIMLILGGFVLLAVDRLAVTPHYTEAMEFPPALALKIGLFQTLAMIPGVSRSGATIVGGLLLGADKRAAAEFSFYLAIPTMAGAFAFDLYKNWPTLDISNATPIVIGFVTAFLAALVVVRVLLEFVSRHGYAAFGWWRIIVGAAGLAALQLGH